MIRVSVIVSINHSIYKILEKYEKLMFHKVQHDVIKCFVLFKTQICSVYCHRRKKQKIFTLKKLQSENLDFFKLKNDSKRSINYLNIINSECRSLKHTDAF